ncbi:MAG TPA: trimethylamine methyltransferase family protein, partial [Candidatus Polarisedimenticolia bacterium]|nr:trimethylamine methyltransferase family protein [Candidatus Polarisedimenticolia bacterium]
YTSFPAFADPRTGMTNYRDPRRFWAAAAATQMGHALNMPCLTSGEMASLLTRPDLLCFGGLLEVSTLLSYEQLVIDHEILRDLFLAASTQELNAESLALEVIRDVGPGGHYLAQKHTVRHIREFVTPKFTEPDRAVEPARPAAAADTDPREQARQEVRRILASHQVPPLPATLETALEKIIGQPAPVATG